MKSLLCHGNKLQLPLSIWKGFYICRDSVTHNNFWHRIVPHLDIKNFFFIFLSNYALMPFFWMSGIYKWYITFISVIRQYFIEQYFPVYRNFFSVIMYVQPVLFVSMLQCLLWKFDSTSWTYSTLWTVQISTYRVLRHAVISVCTAPHRLLE